MSIFLRRLLPERALAAGDTKDFVRLEGPCERKVLPQGDLDRGDALVVRNCEHDVHICKHMSAVRRIVAWMN